MRFCRWPGSDRRAQRGPAAGFVLAASALVCVGADAVIRHTAGAIAAAMTVAHLADE